MNDRKLILLVPLVGLLGLGAIAGESEIDTKEEDVPRYPYTVKIQGAISD